jgi:hypothetical protein
VPGDQLREFGKNNRGWPEDELGCSECRRKRLTHLVSVPEKGKEEVTMSERKAIASIQVFPNQMEDDYDIEGFVRVGGVKIEIDTNMNRLRDFFTKRRAKKERLLKAEVYKRDPSKAVPPQERC